MKPRYIEMKAFGSYQEERIDFTGIDHGLFLVTGDTGAGKTTIFDAITYALFGETSGGKRDGRMMRSQYASAGVRTEVKFCFLYADQEYTIIRIPEQPNWKKDKETGEYKQLKGTIKPSVELILPDGSSYPGKIREIDQKITELLGLNCQQFTQIAMLAQGEFMKLLHASSEERKEIFAKIFDTRIYGLIEQEIKKRFDEINQLREANKYEIRRELEQIRCVEKSALEEAWNSDPYQNRFSESDREGLLALAGRICDEADAQYQKLQQERAQNEAELRQAEQSLQQAQAVNRLFEELQRTQQTMQELEARTKEIEAYREQTELGLRAGEVWPFYSDYTQKKTRLGQCKERAEQLKRWIAEHQTVLEHQAGQAEAAQKEYEAEAPKLHAQISQISESISGYEEMETLAEEQKTLTTQMDGTERQIRTTEETLQKYEKEQEHLQEEIERRKECAAALAVLEVKIAGLQKEREDLNALIENVEVMETLEGSMRGRKVWMETGNSRSELQTVTGNSRTELQAEADSGKTDLQDEESYSEAQNRILISSLRAGLQEGQPCPVCGRIHHSQEALRQSLSETETALQKLQLERDDAGRECRRRKEFEKDQKSIAAKEEKCRKDLERQKTLLSSEKLKNSECQMRLQLLRSRLTWPDQAAARRELQQKKDRLHTLEQTQREKENEYRTLKGRMDGQQGKLAQEEQNLADLKTDVQQAQEAYETALQQQGFLAEADFLEARLERSKIMELQQQIKDHEIRWQITQNDLARLQRDTEGKQVVDTGAYRSVCETLSEKKTELEQQDRSLHTITQNNQSALEKARSLYQKRADMDQKHKILNSLNDTANGKKHMKFQTYVQRYFFKTIIASANQRLYRMSGGQFILQCRDVKDLGRQGYVGLDLDVYSIVNEQCRDVKTLSGGESFMAALSMALGMADIIQNSTGRVHIDTMFIDEGFGSLSEETRNQAIQVLSELSEGKRLVGIISHVSELKAQVETKLVVSKTEKGSKARWE